MLGHNHNPTQLAFLSGSFHSFLEYPIGNFLRGEQSKYRASLLREAIERASKKQRDGYSTTDAKRDFVNNINNDDRMVLGEAIHLPHTRLTEGAAVGYIDYGLGVIKKYGDIWRDIATTQPFQKLTEIRKWVQGKGVYFCDVITDKELSRFETKGFIKVSGEIVARRNGINSWVCCDSRKTINGNVSDVLYKLAIPYISSSGKGTKKPLYIGESDSQRKHTLFANRLYVSSKHTACTIQANPATLSDKISTKGSRLHEFALPENTCVYHANWSDRKTFKCILNTPSPFLISAISNDYGNNLDVQIARNKAISKIHSSKNNYETYTALVEWNQELLSIFDQEQKQPPIEIALRAMGYDSLAITPPAYEDILELIVTQNELSQFDSSLLNVICTKQLTPDHVSRITENYIESINQAASNVFTGCTNYIYFNHKKSPSKVKSIELPPHYHTADGYNTYDSFYDKSNSDSGRFSEWAIKVLAESRRLGAN